MLNCLDQFFKWVPGHDEPKGWFSPQKESNFRLDAVEDNVRIDMSNMVTLALVCSILCGKKWNKNRRPKRHRSSVKGDMYKVHSLEYSHLYIKLSLNTCRWDGLCDEKGG